MPQIILNGTTADLDPYRLCTRRREPIGVVSEPGRIDPFELNREVRRAAIVYAVKTVWFAAGRIANQDDFNANPP